MARSKVVVNGEVYIDLSNDNITAANVDEGVTFHLPNGEAGVGTSTKDADTSDATLLDAEAAAGKTFYKDGIKHTGTAPVRGGVTGEISDVDESYTIPIGLHDGSGTVSISATEAAKLKNHQNIKAGVEILGELGEYSGEDAEVQAKTATPSFSSQVILPDTGYDYLSQVTVAAIPITEVVNASGGTTVTIG